MSDTQESSTGAAITATQHARTKRAALFCSQQVRRGKFHRVSKDFLHAVDAAVEKLRREIEAKYPATTFPDIFDANDNDCPTPQLLTKHQRQAILRSVEFMVGRLIQRKVERHPSVGKTLG